VVIGTLIGTAVAGGAYVLTGQEPGPERRRSRSDRDSLGVLAGLENEAGPGCLMAGRAISRGTRTPQGQCNIPVSETTRPPSYRGFNPGLPNTGPGVFKRVNYTPGDSRCT